MKRAIAGILLTILLSFGFCGPLLACHDQGQGKSQDCGDLGDIATAPEPSTFWLLRLGFWGLRLPPGSTLPSQVRCHRSE